MGSDCSDGYIGLFVLGPIGMTIGAVAGGVASVVSERAMWAGLAGSLGLLAGVLVAALVDAVRRHVEDRKVLAAIGDELARVYEGG